MCEIVIIYIPDNDIENVKKLVRQNLKAIIGTMKIHQLSSCSPGHMRYRNLSCFCGINRGLCNCFDPKTHAFNNKSSQKVANTEYAVIDTSADAMNDGPNCLNYLTKLESLNSINIKANKNLSPKVAKKKNSDFEVITVAADIHVDNLDYLPKPKIPNVLASNKENVYINSPDLPISVNDNIVNLGTNDVDDRDVIVMGGNSFPAHTTPEDLDRIVIDLMLDEKEKKTHRCYLRPPLF